MVLICTLTNAGAMAYASHHGLGAEDWAWLNEPDVIRHYPGATVVLAHYWRGRSNADEIEAELATALAAHRIADVVVLD